MTSPRPVPLQSKAGRVLSVAPTVLRGRDAIEAHVERLNRASPAAKRSINDWKGSAEEVTHQVAAIPLGPSGAAGGRIFMAEVQTSFGMEMIVRDRDAVPSSYSVALPITGSMKLWLVDGQEVTACAGEGLIIDPARIDRNSLAVGTHFLEFDLPKSQLQLLGAEMGGDVEAALAAPAEVALFQPLLHSALSQKLLFMATQAAAVQRSCDRPDGGAALFRRWSELLSLTLLHEQRTAPAVPSEDRMNAASAAALRRAVDFIHANAQRDILLADIAGAAFVSTSRLIRMFNAQLGETPGAFLRHVRLDRARAELRAGLVGSVRELAHRWGFQNASKFSQAFTRRFGEQPSKVGLGDH